MKSKIILVFFLSLLVFFSGCSGKANNAFSSSPSINSFRVAEFVGDSSIQISSKSYSEDDVANELGNLSAECKSALEKKPYTVFFAENAEVKLKLFVDEKKGEVVCVHKEDLAAGQCSVDFDCSDGLESTIDVCNVQTKTCNIERTTQCVAGDNYCPAGCVKAADADCLRECISNTDCSDSDDLTFDACVGVIGACNHTLALLEAQKVSCSQDSDCVSDDVCSAGFCNEGLCAFKTKENGSVCGVLKDCYGGECVESSSNPFLIYTPEITWVKDKSVEFSWVTNKIASSKLEYGVSQQAFLSLSGDYLKLSHSFLVDDLQFGQKYYYQFFSTDAQEVYSTQTAVLEFKNCFSCDDKDSCTIDSCDLETGECSHQPDTQNQACSS